MPALGPDVTGPSEPCPVREGGAGCPRTTGVSSPSMVAVISTATPATPALYHAKLVNGVLGNAKAQAR